MGSKKVDKIIFFITLKTWILFLRKYQVEFFDLPNIYLFLFQMQKKCLPIFFCGKFPEWYLRLSKNIRKMYKQAKTASVRNVQSEKHTKHTCSSYVQKKTGQKCTLPQAVYEI